MKVYSMISFNVNPYGDPYINFGFSKYVYDDIRFDDNDTEGRFKIVIDELFSVRCQEVLFRYSDLIGLYRFSDMSTGADLERTYDLWCETVIE